MSKRFTYGTLDDLDVFNDDLGFDKVYNCTFLSGYVRLERQDTSRWDWTIADYEFDDGYEPDTSDMDAILMAVEQWQEDEAARMGL